MELAWLVYGINVVSSLNTAIGISAFISILVLGICSIAWFICAINDYSDDAKATFKVWKIIAWITIPLTLLSCFVPSERTMYTMVGAYAAEKVAQDPKVQQLSGKVLAIIETKLDDIINEKDKKK